MSPKKTQSFDYIFIGMGAANCLLLLACYRQNLLHNAKIAIIEPSEKEVNDRTFCFWATEDKVQALHLSELVSSKWQQIKVANCEIQSIAPQSYYHIKGLDLYNKVKNILKELTVTYFRETYHSEPVTSEDLYLLDLSELRIEAPRVFDSRPPTFQTTQNNKIHLLQSFYGWEVQTRDACFDKETMVMMDFEVPQHNACQFLYLLPFSENSALLEVTRFGKDKIKEEEATLILRDYLTILGFDYEIIDKEEGVIPMSTFAIEPTNRGKNWIAMGANAMMVKPSTGYAFLNMANDAHKLAHSLHKNHTYIRKKPKSRFAFYDNLLLNILDKKPEHGKSIFMRLFHGVPIQKVLLFLSEKSSLSQELKIFSKLPILLFLQFASIDILARIRTLSPVWIAFSVTLFSILSFSLNLTYLPWIIVVLGFLTVGLSHGAVDHLTEGKVNSRKALFRFVLSYLSKGFVLGIVWIFLPDMALLGFVLFSAWHFGQADTQEWQLSQGANAFLWGLIVLSTLLGFHLEETVEVLSQIEGLQTPFLLHSISDGALMVFKAVLAAASLLLLFKNKSKQMFFTLLYLLLSSLLPLLLAFGIYFVMQHSLHGWKHLKKELKMNNYSLGLQSLPFNLGGMGLFALFALGNISQFAGLFFILLSCMSMPHVMCMHHFYLGTQTKPGQN